MKIEKEKLKELIRGVELEGVSFPPDPPSPPKEIKQVKINLN